MTETKGKKALSLCILRVLEQHATERDPLSTRRIIEYLKEDFGMIAERKAVGRNLILLTEMGGDYANFLALSLVAFTSYVVADLLRGRPIYDQLLDRMLAGSNPEKKKDSAAAKGRTS